jgi:hypothetical protein
MTRRFTRLIVPAASLVLCVAAASAQQPAPGAPGMPSKKEIAAALAQSGKPAPEHKNLAPLVGEFDFEVRMNVAPGAPPIVAKGTNKAEWVLGERFVASVTEPAADEELKVGSISYFGYDKRTKKYFWFGIDSTDTYSVFAEGDYDPATRTFTLYGENLEEQLGGKARFKNVLTLNDDGSRTMKIMFQAPEAVRGQMPPGMADKDGWFLAAEMVATRKKK